MKAGISRRLGSLGAYAFAEVDRLAQELRDRGVDPIDFGVGDPTDPTPDLVRSACSSAVETRARSGYPPYVGLPEYRRAVAAWTKRRFGVDLAPDAEICSTIGSKEGVFHAPLAFTDPGDVVIAPTPGYPPYSRGAMFAGAKTWFYPLLPQNDFLPDFDRIPDEVWKSARMLWVNYPNSPSGKVAAPAFFERAVALARSKGVLLCSDEAYSEIYYGERPPSALQFGLEGVLAFFSMSKRSAMTNYRSGWVAGDREAVAAFKKVKTNVDSGTPTFVQDAAIAALLDESHVDAMRESYRRKRDALCAGFSAAGFPECVPEGALYVWQKLKPGMGSERFCKELLDPEIAIIATPGAWISDRTDDGLNPGEGFARFALVPPLEKVLEAAGRIGKSFAR